MHTRPNTNREGGKNDHVCLVFLSCVVSIPHVLYMKIFTDKGESAPWNQMSVGVPRQNLERQRSARGHPKCHKMQRKTAGLTVGLSANNIMFQVAIRWFCGSSLLSLDHTHVKYSAQSISRAIWGGKLPRNTPGGHLTRWIKPNAIFNIKLMEGVPYTTG